MVATIDRLRDRDSGEGADALGCPQCRYPVTLHELVTDADAEVLGYVVREDAPLVAVCENCQVAYTMEEWHALKL